MKRIFNYIMPLLLVAGCNGKSAPEPEPVLPITHTLIVYMAADNNLSGYAVDNINSMEAAYNDNLGTRVLIYYDQPSGKNQLLELTNDSQSESAYQINSTVIKDYGDDHNPMLPATLSQVIADCREYSPTERYSIIFWSHATGWLPQGMHPASAPPAPNSGVDRTFGDVYTHSEQMEIYDLVRALPTDIKFEYIYFDACHMASIEVAYEIRSSAKYLIASAAEVLANGYPYRDGMDELLKVDVEGIAKEYYNYYRTQQSVTMRSATVSVTELSKMDAVAAAFRELTLGSAVQPTAEQQYGRYLGSTSDFRDLMWDVEDMVVRSYGTVASEAFLLALRNAVIYEAATDWLFRGDGNGEIEVNVHSGLSIYIPRASEPETVKIYTDNYQWAIDTEFYNSVY